MSPTISPRQPVHPHARGERDWLLIVTTAAAGSSPRPWGTPVIAPGVRLQRRFIPTPVGNASRSRRSARTAPVHPHARGERAPHTLTVGQVGGSSPRPWGTLRDAEAVPRQGRFIPTPVGNARTGSLTSDRTTVHPHARGERPVLRTLTMFKSGSSPRPWGTHRADHRRRAGRRFIPTPVGNAPSPPPKPTGRTVHPHARGERRRVYIKHSAYYGSSPRPWGTPHHILEPNLVDRFIPTPVGNARRSSGRSLARPVHPHARGERRSISSCMAR